VGQGAAPSVSFLFAGGSTLMRARATALPPTGRARYVKQSLGRSHTSKRQGVEQRARGPTFPLDGEAACTKSTPSQSR